MTEPPLLDIAGLRRTYRRSGRTIPALDGVDLTVRRGETMGLAGASGSGKTTLARAVMRLVDADAGAIRFDGIDLLALRGARLRQQRSRLQMVFQEPLAAFNPRATVARILEDPLRIHRLAPRRDRRDATLGLLARVGLSAELIDRRPHEISGGQRQRVAIARAIATKPELIVLDEPVSALDVSVRAQILNLLLDLQAESGVAYLFISHDLAVIRAVCHRVAVMDQGRIVETGEPDVVLRSPKAEATQRLVEAVPRLVLSRAWP